MTNITLNVDDGVIKKVKKIAIDQDTTMASMIRRFLRSVAESEDRERQRKIALLENSFEDLGCDMGERTWARDDLYE